MGVGDHTPCTSLTGQGRLSAPHTCDAILGSVIRVRGAFHVYLEALATGVPVLASATGLASDSYADGHLDCLVNDSNNQSAWAVSPDNCINRLSPFAVEKIDRSFYSVAAIGSDMVQAYKSLCGKATRS